MALVANMSYTPFKTNTKSPASTKRDRLYCTHCRIQGHTFETCFEIRNARAPSCTHCKQIVHVANRCYQLHGYPLSHKFYKGKNVGSSTNQVNFFLDSNQE